MSVDIKEELDKGGKMPSAVKEERSVAISLVIAAHSPLGNEVVCRAFNPRRRQFNILGSACTRTDLIKQVAEHRPDIAVISASLQDGPTSGLLALPQLSQACPSTRSIVLLDSGHSDHVIEAFSRGARGVLAKSEGFEALCKCIRSVHAGQVWADSNQLRWVVQALGDREPVRIVSATGTALLTEREEQIVRMVAEGLPNGEICTTLGLSAHTVKNHLFRIYEKLGVSNRVELVLYALSKRDAQAGRDEPFGQSPG
jgi:DNA-binding NarL/FixJ family response regulator